VLTGQINDVGGYTRTNVNRSYRAGVELELGYQIIKSLSISGNITLSQNKIESFNEYVDSYDAFFNYVGQDTIQHSNTDLAFSPKIISALGLSYRPLKGLEIGIVGKYVGDQFLDNTSTGSRKINAYFISNLQLSYTLTDVLLSEITFGIQVNNLFDTFYVNNGYTWGYIYGGERTVENFYYAQAGRNIMTRLTIKF
jgi:iron complex outermembrane receptor protein